jgi:hypothetical protein
MAMAMSARRGERAAPVTRRGHALAYTPAVAWFELVFEALVW